MKKFFIALIVILLLGLSAYAGYRYYLLAQSEKASPASTISASPTPSLCEDFADRYGVTIPTLIAEINSSPETKIVLAGFQKLIGEVTGYKGSQSLPLTITLDSNAKITDWKCEASATYNPTADVKFTIPEADFGNLIRNHDTLDGGKAVASLNNLTTDPAPIKQIILNRLQGLN